MLLEVVAANAGTTGPNAKAAKAANEPADASTVFLDLFRVIPSPSVQLVSSSRIIPQICFNT